MAIYKSIYTGPQIDEGITKANEAATVESVNSLSESVNTLTGTVSTHTTAINNLTNNLNETNENVASNLESIISISETVSELEDSIEPSITIVNELPEANEENFEKGKIYTTGELLQYISKVALSEPNVENFGTAQGSSYPNSATSIGDNIYYHVGSKQLYKIDTKNWSFTQLPFTSQNGNYAQIISVGNNIYLFFGYYDNTSGSYIYKYDTLTGEYSLCTSWNTSFESVGIAKVGNNIYTFGGRVSGNYAASGIYKFDTETNVFEKMNVVLPKATQGICAVSYGNDIYLFGGVQDSYVGSGSGSKTIYKYNTISNNLTTLETEFPYAISFATGQVIGEDIYIFGGLNNNTGIYKFNTRTNEISLLSLSLPEAKKKNTCSTLIGQNVYVMGGEGYAIIKAQFGYTFQYKTIATS